MSTPALNPILYRYSTVSNTTITIYNNSYHNIYHISDTRYKYEVQYFNPVYQCVSYFEIQYHYVCIRYMYCMYNVYANNNNTTHNTVQACLRSSSTSEVSNYVHCLYYVCTELCTIRVRDTVVLYAVWYFVYMKAITMIYELQVRVCQVSAEVNASTSARLLYEILHCRAKPFYVYW